MNKLRAHNILDAKPLKGSGKAQTYRFFRYDIDATYTQYNG